MIILAKRGISPFLALAALSIGSVLPATATEFDFSYTGLSGGASLTGALIYTGTSVTEFKGTSSGLTSVGLGSTFDITSGITTSDIYYSGPTHWLYEIFYAGRGELNISSDSTTDGTLVAPVGAHDVLTPAIYGGGNSVNLPYGGGTLITATPAPTPGTGPYSWLALILAGVWINRKKMKALADGGSAMAGRLRGSARKFFSRPARAQPDQRPT